MESDSSDAIGRCIMCVMVPALVKSRKAIDYGDDVDALKSHFDAFGQQRDTLASLKARVQDAVSHGWHVEDCVPHLIDALSSALSRRGQDALIRAKKDRKQALEALETLSKESPLNNLVAEICRVDIGKQRARQLFAMCCEASAVQFCTKYRVFKRLDVAITGNLGHVLVQDVVSESEHDSTHDAAKCEVDISPDAMKHLSKLCGCLSAMVALWRSLRPDEKRAAIADNASKTLGGYEIPEQLSKLLSQAAKGQTTYLPA